LGSTQIGHVAGDYMAQGFYYLKNIYRLLTEGFNDAALDALCLVLPGFELVYQRLPANIGRAILAIELLEYAEKTLQLDTLLALARERNPVDYEKYGPYKLTREQQVGRARRWSAEGRKYSLNQHDLAGIDLRGVDLAGADLRFANLSQAVLCQANLQGANLSRANLSRADLSGADLRGAELSAAILRRANLSRADLRRTNLKMASLRWAILSGADLRGAQLNRRACYADRRYLGNCNRKAALFSLWRAKVQV
jgi:uncharacterized protein YjbI with pentapeptide repeats